MKDLRNRLEEAADNICGCAECAATIIGGGCKKKCVTHEFYIAGAEYGIKEAIAQAKEWLKGNWDISDFNSIDEFVATFEADMNKLWEEKK